MRIRKKLTGEPVTIGRRSILPIAKVDVRYVGIGRSGNGVALGWGCIVPHEVEVRNDDGSIRRVDISRGSRGPRLGMMIGAGAIAFVCSALMAVAGRRMKTFTLTDQEI